MNLNKDRKFTSSRRVRVSDCDEQGIARIDAIARYLQDIGFDDTNDIGVGDGGLWVARKVEIVFPQTANWPQRNDLVRLETFCGGVGSVCAQRMVNIFSAQEEIKASTIWVHIDENGRPKKVPSWLGKAYPEAKKIKPPRLSKGSLDPKDRDKIEFFIRQSDFDVNGHVNNAVSFIALYEVGQKFEAKRPMKVEVEYKAPISSTDNIELFAELNDHGFEAQLISDNNIAWSMKWICSLELEGTG